jgi:hypothetical protein
MTTIQDGLLTELEPVVEANLNRHLEQAKPWNPHDFIPGAAGVTSLCWVVRTGPRRTRTSTRFPKPP